ncbi:MAG: xylose isomerase [Pirellulaceae bacterium]|nr:MAG: xylose isomerase [Pirellulaceae bacterium]
MAVRIGYCTNVHPATDTGQMLEQWKRYALPVRRGWPADEPMGLGLWLPAEVVRQLSRDPELSRRVRQFLDENQLLPFTANGFPYGDFHSPIVKHNVYFPTWWDPRRADYTMRIADILDSWLPEGEPASISTLPISWGCPPPDDEELKLAARHLLSVARHLADLEARTGRRIVLALEPEPGCALQRSGDVTAFFERYLWPIDRSLCHAHLGVCHDICHAAVMNEQQTHVLELYRQAGIAIGKLQISSAVRMVLSGKAPDERARAFEQLSSFNEPKYLHQTTVRQEGITDRFFEDLPLALGYYPEVPAGGIWHVHFHVPVYLKTFGALQATDDALRECLRWICRTSGTFHWEVETYAWNVLPAHLKQPSLADGIRHELEHVLALRKQFLAADDGS